MTITGAAVLFLTLWFLVLFVALPIGLRTQGEAGEVVPGTPASAPAEAAVGRKMLWVTVVAVALWLGICGVIVYGGVTVRDIDVWGRM